jgi:hypothetical protein
MKKVFYVLAVMLLTLTASVTAAAEEPLPVQLEYIDAQLTVFLPKLAEFQADYYATNGIYYQALESHSVVPAGAEVASDLESHPTYQDANLASLWDATGLPASINFSFRVNQYQGPSGDGYQVVITTIVDGQTWEKTIDTGPNDEPWHQITMPEG